MSWVRLDDGIFDNPKIAAISDAAQLAHIKAIVYCAKALTDGDVPLRKAKEYATPKVIQELVPSLWEPTEAGFRVHDYLAYNPSREQVLREREAAKQRMQGARSARVRPNIDRSSPSPDPVPLPDPLSRTQTQTKEPPKPPLRLPARAVVVGFEQCFGRLLSPMELEQVKALEDEHPPERIEYALGEAAALNKRSVRYVQRTCERIERDGESSADGRGKSAAAEGAGGVADRVPGLDRRRAAIAQRRRDSEQANTGLRPVGT